MEYMIMPIKRYFDFSGRSRRMEYWMFVLFQIIVLGALMFLGAMMGAFEEDGSNLDTVFVAILALVYFGLFFIPSISVQVRRFHDQGKTGWLILLGFIPYVGGLIMLVFMCIDGDKGSNEYGPDPKDPTDASVFD